MIFRQLLHPVLDPTTATNDDLCQGFALVQRLCRNGNVPGGGIEENQLRTNLILRIL